MAMGVTTMSSKRKGNSKPSPAAKDTRLVNTADNTQVASEKVEVGYRRPPRATQFQPGTSGNPGGKKKGTANLDTLIARELEEKVEVRENGVVKTLTKREVGVKAMVNKAVQADIRAWPIIFERNFLEAEDNDIGPAEKAALFAYLKRTLPDGEQGT